MTKQASPKYFPEVRERAVRIVFGHQGDHASHWAVIGSIAAGDPAGLGRELPGLWRARSPQRHTGRMKIIFIQMLELCRGARLIPLRLMALDGTKMKVNAAPGASRTAGIE